jgi:hypothetical protein
MSNARANNGREVLAKLAKIYKFYKPVTSPVVDSVPGALALDDAVITVQTFASVSTGDYLIVEGTGRMDLLKLGTKPGSAGAIPLLERPVCFAQEAGAIITVASRKDLGYIEDAGASLSASASKTGIGAANSRGPIVYIDGDTPEITVGWAQRESSERNILQSFGIHEDSVRGTGVANDPYRGIISADNIGSEANLAFRIASLLANGKTKNFDLLNCFPEVSVSANIVSKGQPTVWGVSVKCTDIVSWTEA